MSVNKTDTRRNLWHKLLGKIFEELLTPVNVTVETGFPIMAGSPEADVLLIRRNQPRWTEAQRSLLRRHSGYTGGSCLN